MPRIPLSEGQQLQPMRHDAVHAPVSIAGDFGMENSRALMTAADRIRNAGEKIAGAGLAFASALVEKENHLAAAEDRNLLTRLGGELENMIRNSPGASDEEKESWIRGYQEKYEDERKQYVDKMSPGFRKQHDVEIAGIRTRFANDRDRIIIQGKVTRLYDHTMALAKNYALAGDAENYKRTLDEARSGEHPLISQEQYDTLMLEYPRLADFGAARRAVDANEVNIDKKLVEQKDGKYVNFPNLTPQQREQLAKTAKVKRHEAETESLNKYLAGLNDGSIADTPEDLKAKHDAGEISDRVYNTALPWVNEIGKKRDAEANAEWVRGVESREIETTPKQIRRDFELGKIPTEAQRDFRIDYLQKREKATEKARKATEKARKAAEQRWKEDAEQQRKDKINVFKLNVDFTEWSSDSGVNVEQFKELEKTLKDIFPGDLHSQTEMFNYLKNAAGEGLAGKGVFNTMEGKVVFDFIKKEYRKADGTFRKLKWDPGHWYWPDTRKDDSQEFMSKMFYEIMDYAKYRLRKGDKAPLIIEDIKARVGKVNDGISRTIYARPARKLEPGVIKNGYEYTGGDPAKKESWRKLK